VTEPADERILVAAPHGRDGTLMIEVLARAGYQATACANAGELAAGIDEGPGLALVTSEFLDDTGLELLSAALRRQPPWSDLPVLFFTPGEPSSAADAASQRLQELGNVGLLERPIRMATLLSAISSGLRSRRHQYEMRRLLAALQEGVVQRDQFLAMLGHELRNPLAAIVTAVEVMELRAGEGEAADAKAQRAVIRRQGRVLGRLVDDLLDVARVTSGKVRLQLEPVDLATLVRRSVEAVAAIAERQKVALRCRVETTRPLAASGDATRLEQVLLNLLNNALKYTPEGGAVDVTLAAQGGQAVIAVRDTGIGVEGDVLPRIFDLFRQADRALHRSGGGLGLGLTVSRSLVELHGGSMSAASDGLGKGSTFSVRLPLVDVPLAAAPEAAEASVAPNSEVESLRVFVVEDQEDARSSLVALMEALGCTVESAADGRSGVAGILRALPDVAIVDIGLPLVDGYEVARRIRRALGPRIALVAMTGYGQAEDRARALGAGFDQHLTKPVDAAALKAVLDRVRAAAAL
jgi:signal transduction histidine kinase/ActR/RegA family two-component response regulator